LFSGVGGFLPGMKQIGNVASLPGIVKVICLYYTFLKVGVALVY